MNPWRTALALFFLFPAVVWAQPPDIVVSAKADRPKMLLSESVRVTVAIEGAAPLRVELPTQLLTADADGSWRIRPEGEIKTAPLPNERERWQRVYRLDPYAPGKPLRATFAPVIVNGQQVTWPAVEVIVERTGGEDAPLPEPRPVTAVEDLPHPPPPPREASPWWIAIVIALVGAVIPVVVWKRTRRPKPIPPADRARAALAKLDASTGRGGVIVERVAAILREFVERRFAVPATKLTTAELSAAATQQGWPVEEAQALRALLDECDRAKFAGDTPDADGCRRLISAAVDWVNDISRPAGPG